MIASVERHITDPNTNLRVAHMLLRVGTKLGLGKEKDAGLVFYAYDGAAYAVSQVDIKQYDYALFMDAVRQGEIRMTLST